jgi:hypothetical protein
MKYKYTEVINKLVVCFNELEHLDETELADKVKEVIKELQDRTIDMCSCGMPINESYDGYCSDCG